MTEQIDLAFNFGGLYRGVNQPPHFHIKKNNDFLELLEFP